jgi:hypothetical protein
LRTICHKIKQISKDQIEKDRGGEEKEEFRERRVPSELQKVRQRMLHRTDGKKVQYRISTVKGDNKKYWFGKHCNKKQHTNQSTEQNFEIIKVENNTKKRKLKKQMKII